MPIEIECPSGLKGKVRGLTGKDGRFLTDRKLTKSGRLTDAILESCWLETTDLSIYKGELDWGKVLVGDRFYALIQIKVAAEEDSTHTFRHQCTNEACREPFDQEIDLDELPVRMLQQEAKDSLKAGKNEFSVRMPTTEQRKQLKDGSALAIVNKKKAEIVPDTGDRIIFKLFTGEDELRLFKLDKQDKLSENKLIQSLSQRIVRIETEKQSEGDEPTYEMVKAGGLNSGFAEYLEQFPMSAIMRLVDRMDELDCGVDTLIEIDCPHCGNLMQVELPLGESFFFPRNRRVVT